MSLNLDKGSIMLKTLDNVKFPPKDGYKIRIKALMALVNEIYTTLSFNIKDPCPTAALTMYQPSPITDQTYYLRDDRIDMYWVQPFNEDQTRPTYSDLIKSSTLVYCGPLAVTFFDSDTMGAYNTAIFTEENGVIDNEFSIPYTEEVGYQGTYNFGVSAYYVNYADNHLRVADDYVHFTVEVIDPCVEPRSLDPPVVLVSGH